jgi:hypothetical protein
MKKIFSIFLLTISILGLAGCGTRNKIAPVQENRTGGLQITENNTLLGWLKRGKTVQCTVSSSGDKLTIMVKNGKVRIEGMPFVMAESDRKSALPENGISLFAGSITYMWDKFTLEGVKLNQKSLADLQAGTTAPASEGKTEDWEKMAESWESADDAYECKEKEMPDDLFMVPANVRFQDLTAIPESAETATIFSNIGKP